MKDKDNVVIAKKDEEIKKLKKEKNNLLSIIKQFNNELEEKIAITTQNANDAYQKLEQREKELNEKVLELISMKEVSEAVSSLYDLDIVLKLILNLALGHLNAEQGSIMLLDKEKKILKIEVAYGLKKQIVDETIIKQGESIAGFVAENGQPLLIKNIEEDTRFNKKHSDGKYTGKSLLCVPLKTRNHILGVINVNNKVGPGVFNNEDLEIITSFANQAAIAIEKARMQKAIAREQKFREVYDKYLSTKIIEKIMGQNLDVALGGKQQVVTVLFLDIRGFTAMAEKMSAKTMIQTINRFFGKITDIIFEYDGMLDKYLGDGLLAVFGAPITAKDDPIRAVYAALKIIKTVKKSFTSIKENYGKPLQVGIGINTGHVVAGNVGSSKRMDYTVIGDAVNIAYRLEKTAGPQEIVMSEETYKKVKNIVSVMLEGVLTLKGRSQKVKYFAVSEKNHWNGLNGKKEKKEKN